MYAIANVRKFVDEHPDIPAEQADAYVAAASEYVEPDEGQTSCEDPEKTGVIVSMVIDTIFDRSLAGQFHSAFASSEEHTQLCIRIMTARYGAENVATSDFFKR